VAIDRWTKDNLVAARPPARRPDGVVMATPTTLVLVSARSENNGFSFSSAH